MTEQSSPEKATAAAAAAPKPAPAPPAAATAPPPAAAAASTDDGLPKPAQSSTTVPAAAAQPSTIPAASDPAPCPPSPQAVATATAEFQSGEHWTSLGMPAEDDDDVYDDADSAFGSDAASSTASLSSSILAYRTVNGRTYHSDRGSIEYWGPNDEANQTGMDIQHYVWTAAYGDVMHMAPISDDIESAVDIGTGTGLWAIHFADMHPNCRIVGTDLSPIQPSWIPPNLHFQVDDCTLEWTFAEESLDYVHLRWLAGSIPDWPHFMNQAYRCLKPGGWIEHLELDGAFFSDDGTILPGSALDQWGPLFAKFGQTLAKPVTFSIVKDGLQRTYMEEAGFVNVSEKRVKLPIGPWPKDPELKKLGSFQLAAIEADLEGWFIYAATSQGWSREQIGVYCAYARKELRSPRVHSYLLSQAVWGQKPYA